MEKKPGASFRALFGSTLALGTLSRRRVLYEALKYEKERNGGRLSPFGFSTFTVAAAVGDVKSIEVVLTIVSRNKCFLYCYLQFSVYGILCPSIGKLMCSHFDAVVRDSAQEESCSGQCQGVQSYSMAMAWISHPGLDQTQSQTSPFDE
jgi:hypothetical protein